MDKSSNTRADILEIIRRAITSERPLKAGEQRTVFHREAEYMKSRVADIGSEISLQCFLDMLQLAGGEGHILTGDEAAVSVVRGILNEDPGQAVLISADLELERLTVSRLIEEAGGEALHHGEVPLDRAAEAGIGITTAQAGIADTGTIVLSHTAERGRLAALLPPVHIALLRRSRVFPDKISYLACARHEGIDLGSTSMTWVTGPSLTADIEKILVRGAHGPRRLIVLLY